MCAVTTALASLSVPCPVRADEPDRAACVQAYVDAQAGRKTGERLRARGELELCAKPSCPGMVQRDCSTWLEEVNRALPTVVLVVRDEKGRDRLDVTALADGAPVALDGHPVALDPGPHTVLVRTQGARTKEERFVLAEGEHDRSVVVVLPSSAAEQPPESARGETSRSVPAASWVLGGAAVVSLGVFGYFAARGASDRSTFGCDRGCGSADYNQVNREFWAGDAALGIGLALAGAAAIVWLVSGESSGGATRASTAPWRVTF
jgi:hypothetical protein